MDIGYSDNPQVKWEIVSQSDENVAELSQVNGITTLTAKRDGTVTIRATAVATGLTDEVTVKSYIPATDIELSTPDHNVIVKQKDGVTVTNLYSDETYPLSASAVAANGEKASSSLLWSTNNSDVLEVDSSTGSLTAKNAGKATISVEIDGIKKEWAITVLDIDVKSGETPLTDSSISVPGWAWSDPVNVQLVFTNNNTDGYSCVWGLEGDENKKKDDSFGHNFVISENNFTASLNRGSDGYSYAVGAYLKLNGTTIAVASFTATP